MTVNIYRKADGFTYQLNIAANGTENYGLIPIEYDGVLEQTELNNITSFSIRKNNVTVSLPVTVVKGDTIKIESIVRTNTSNAAYVKLISLNHTQKDRSFAAFPARDMNRKHLFILSPSDQKVMVYDTSNDTFVSTLTLPGTATGESSNWDFRTMHYRIANDHIYLYGANRVCKINANPSDPDFLQITNQAGTVNASSILSFLGSYIAGDCVYDWISDRAFVMNTSTNTISYWNFSTASFSYFPAAQGWQGENICFIPPDKICLVNNIAIGTYKNFDSHRFFTGGAAYMHCSAAYNSKANELYTGTGSISRFNPETLQRIAIISGTGVAGSSAYYQMCSSLCYMPDYDLLFSTMRTTAGKVDICDTVTNTRLGDFVRTNVETNDLYPTGAVYSNYSKKLYLAVNGTSPVYRIHKINPQLWINNGKSNLADMIDGYFDCPYPIHGIILNSSNFGYSEHRLCMNHLIPV